MNEQNRQKLGRIAKRYANRRAQGGGVADEEFLTEFARVRDEVLRPVMEEIGAQLRADGYDFRVDDGGSKRSPDVGLHVVIPGRDGSKDTIRFFAHEDVRRGWQVIAELELARSPTELARFDAGDPITRDVAEHLIVDATEQIFASALATSGPEAREKGAAVAPALGAPFVAANAETVEGHASAREEGAEGARALVLGRLQDGRVLHGLDLVGADLHGLDFTGALMPALDLGRANLRGCALTGANLVAAQLQGADLTDAIFTGANLSRANLTGAVLVRARLDSAVLVDTVGLPVEAPEQAALEEPAHAGENAPGSIDLVPLLAEGPAPALPPLTDAPESRWARWAGAHGVGVGETKEVDVRAFRKAPLPFRGEAPPPAFFAAADAAREESLHAASSATGYETFLLPVIAVGGTPSAPPPGSPALAEPSEPVEELPRTEAIAAPSPSPGRVLIRESEAGEDAPGHCENVLAFGQPSDPALPRMTDDPEPHPVVGETADVDITVFRRRPLPFAKGAPPPAFFAAPDAARAEVRAPRANATGHDTMVLPAMDAPAPRGEGGAGERDAADRGCASLTVEQYAAFCAELAVFPGQAAGIHQKYGVAEESARKALDEAFAQRFRGDPTLQRRWRALVAHYGDWFRSQGAR